MSKHDSRIATTLFTRLVAMICFLLATLAVEGQQSERGAINTSRSNIKNTFRLGTKIDSIKVELAARSGAQSSPVQIKNGKFELGVLPEGEYELRIALDDVASAEFRKQAADGAKFDPLVIDLEGVVGGTQKQELQLDVDPKAESERTRPGKSKFKNIVLRSDGKTPIKGTLRHDMTKNVTRDLR